MACVYGIVGGVVGVVLLGVLVVGGLILVTRADPPEEYENTGKAPDVRP